MINLVKLFAPVASPKISVPLISRVGIDVQGTLAYQDNELDRDLQDFYLFLLTHKGDVNIISTEPEWATSTLVQLGADYRTFNVIQKDDYYRILTESGEYFTAIDDGIPYTRQAAMYIHPRDARFRRFLSTREYERTIEHH